MVIGELSAFRDGFKRAIHTFNMLCMRVCFYATLINHIPINYPHITICADMEVQID